MFEFECLECSESDSQSAKLCGQLSFLQRSNKSSQILRNKTDRLVMFIF